MLDGMVERMERQVGMTCTVIATGLYAGIIAPYCSRTLLVDDKLLLKGLKRIYDKNNRK